MTKAEISLRQFLESTWFKAVRWFVVVVGVPAATMLLGYASVTLGDLKAQITTTATAAATNTANIALLKDEQTKTNGTLAAIQNSTTAIQIDAARMRGILEVIRRDTASDEASNFHSTIPAGGQQ